MSSADVNAAFVGTDGMDTVTVGQTTSQTDTVQSSRQKGAEPVGKPDNRRPIPCDSSRASPAPTPPAEVPKIRILRLRRGDVSRSPAERSITSPLIELKPWCYNKAFARHRGLITEQEQQKLRNTRVAIVGMGGVGGIHLVTLARLGVGRFTIADPDTFETVNFNRQYGATRHNIGRKKAEAMAEAARSINPELQLRVFNEAITPENVGDFLSGGDVLVDGIDFFGIEARRLVFREAKERGICAVTAGPIGFSTAWLVFDPDGMSFDDYFDLHDEMEELDQLIAFAVGLTPRATHIRYMDLSQVNPRAATGPSAGLACQLASGVAAAETLKILRSLWAKSAQDDNDDGNDGAPAEPPETGLDLEPMRPAPWYFQFDAYRHVLRKGRLRWGNRPPWQRLKRYVLGLRIRRILKSLETG